MFADTFHRLCHFTQPLVIYDCVPVRKSYRLAIDAVVSDVVCDHGLLNGRDLNHADTRTRNLCQLSR